jgi:prepilin-type N-terminal cleavage/methylation domain-containing protein
MLYNRKHNISNIKKERVGLTPMFKKVNQKGFTIVELLIVIVVIGILAAIVITQFSGAQQTARNTNRQTDLRSIHGQLEAYFAAEGNYPTLGNLNDAAFRQANLRGLDNDALVDPRDDREDPFATPGPLVGARTVNRYAYVATPTGCDNTTTACESYNLIAVLEGDSGDFERPSLN